MENLVFIFGETNNNAQIKPACFIEISMNKRGYFLYEIHHFNDYVSICEPIAGHVDREQDCISQYAPKSGDASPVG